GARRLPAALAGRQGPRHRDGGSQLRHHRLGRQEVPAAAQEQEALVTAAWAHLCSAACCYSRAVTSVRIVDGADAAVLVNAFPETGAAPVNRHLARFDLQQDGAVTCFAAWADATPTGYVFVRWPGSKSDLSPHALVIGCPELADLFVVDHARGRGFGRQLVE